VKFVQIGVEANVYRDAVHFENGRQILLQALDEGQRVKVLSLDLMEVLAPTGSGPEVQVY
jgi:hypothetical protein